MRKRYGFVSRQSTPSRRRVVFHDQSSTCAAGAAHGAARSGRASGDLLHVGARLDGVGELPLEQAVLVDLAVDGARLEQLLVRAAAAIRPSSSTTISSASAIVDRRCAMISVVRPLITSRSPVRMRASVVASTEAVASSRMRMRGSTASARAIAIRCRCPPESVIPRSPMTVS